jgi:hypothetical protein
MKKFLLLLVAVICVAASAAEVDPNKQTRIALTNFEPNLPVIFLDAKEPIVSERKVPCIVRMLLPKESGSANTGALAGVVRFHGASSQQYPKKSSASLSMRRSGGLGCARARIGCSTRRSWIVH